MKHSPIGKVYLVGAGPGDLGLLTLRAKALLETCDVVVYDYLANPRLLDWVKPDCECVYVGKRPHLHSIAQEKIEDILVDRVRQEKQVVRLKGGDPFIFGRGGEEAERLHAMNIRFEIVPAVTAALGAAAYLGIPLTHREESSVLHLVTGHEDPEKGEPRVDFGNFGEPGSTLCIYMGMGHLRQTVDQMLSAGVKASTPVAIVEWATLARQRSVVATLANIMEKIEDTGITAPSVIFIGETVKAAGKFNWFEQRPLFGKRIVITRNRAQSAGFGEELCAMGADVIELPLIHVKEAPDSEDVDAIFQGLGSYQWIVFTSVNGVKYFFAKFFKKFKDVRSFGGMKIACIGEATAREVHKFHLEVDHIPERATAKSLAESLVSRESLDNQMMLVVTGNRNRDDLVKVLETSMAIVDTCLVYQTELSELEENPVVEDFCEQGADAIVFASSSAVDGFIAQAKKLQLKTQAKHPKIVSMGPMTTKYLRKKQMPVGQEAEQQNVSGIIAAVVKAVG